jgi:protoporphyrinogen oxidase
MAKEDLPIVILGAGSAGLTAATQLAKVGKKVVVVEKENRLGGLAHTAQEEGYRFDLGPHAFHSKQDEVDELFKEFCFGKYKKIYMKACLLLHRKYFDYPLKFSQALLRLNIFFTTKMLCNYFKAQFKQITNELPEDSFESWGIKRYGKIMYEMAFGNYSRKVWGVPTNCLHKKLAQQKLPDMNFWELLKEALGGRGAKQKILYSSYYYPQSGIGTVFENMANFCLKREGRIYKNSEVVKMNLRNNKIHSVEIFTPEGHLEIACSYLLSSIPIPEVINSIYPKPSQNILEYANRLIYRNLVLVFIKVGLNKVTKELMIYLLDEDFKFNRIGEQKNLDSSMIPQNETILSLEICVDEKDFSWNFPDEYFFEMAKQDLLKLKKFKLKDIKGYFVRRLKYAYPIYDLEFDKNLNIALQYFSTIDNLLPFGRQGLFINNDIHDSMQMGLELARHIIEKKDKEDWNRRVLTFLDWRLK